MNQYDEIVRSVSKNPEKEALRYFGVSVSYRELGKMTETVASGLHNIGIKPGDVVCLALPTTPESIATVYALNKIGAIVSMLDVRLTSHQVASIVNNLHAKMLFIMNFNIKGIARVANEMCVDYIVVMRGCELFPKAVSSWYSIGEIFNGRFIAYHSIKKFIHWSNLIALSGEIAPRHEWQSNAPQMIFQTSGTTGRSKSVMLTAENIAVATTYTRKDKILVMPAENDTVLCLIPIFTFSGFVTTVHAPLRYGMTIIIVPIWKPRDFIKTIAKHKPQHVFSVPSMWDTIYIKSNSTFDLSCLKTVIIAGDVMNPDFEHDINKFLHHCGCNSNVIKMYGLTETAGMVSSTPQSSPYKYNLGFSGKLDFGFRVKIIDGEICVLHPTKLLGYYNNQEATNNLLRLHDDGLVWLHTGDYGHLDDDGNLYVTGRIKHMLVRYDGTKIFPIEIKEALLRHPDILDCAVVGCIDKEHPQSSVPIAFCVVSNTGRQSASSIARYVNKELPVYLRPTKIVSVDNLPTLGNGKVDLVKLQEMANEENDKTIIV